MESVNSEHFPYMFSYRERLFPRIKYRHLLGWKIHMLWKMLQFRIEIQRVSRTTGTVPTVATKPQTSKVS